MTAAEPLAMEAAAVEGMPREYLAAVLGAIDAGACIWDEKLRLVAWNDSFRQTHAVPGHLLKVGTRLAAILDAGPRALEDRRSGEETEAGALRGLAARGNLDLDRVYADGRMVSVTYDRFGPRHWLALYHDVTQQRSDIKLLRISERELRSQHAQLDAALDSTPYGFAVWDEEFRLVVCNDKYLAMFNLPADRVHAGTSLRELSQASIDVGNFPGMTADELCLRYLTRFAENRDPDHPQDYQVEAGGRTIRSTYTRSNAGWVATHQDITGDLAKMHMLESRERDLAVQNLRFTAAVNNMSQGLCMFDAEQRLVICNEQYARIYRLPPDLVKPGTLLKDILAYRFEHGVHPVEGVEAYFQRRFDLAHSGREGSDISELSDGRVIAIMHHPMADGGWVATHQDITEQRQKEALIRHTARHDSLTDLPNRLMFHETMEAAEQRLRRRERLALLAIDLDHFKIVNDTLGHGIGDRVLREAAARLRSCCREGDDVFRLGGDEFAILTGPLDAERDAAIVAHRIVTRMAEPLEIEGHGIVIGASVGIAVAPGDGPNGEDLLKNADLALYRAKNEGRGAYHFFERGMDAKLQERRMIEIGLRRALVQNEFRLVFQPLFNLEEKRISCLEALLRWYHPERGTIPPADFVPIAEESGLIVAMGEWVLHEACRAAMAWPHDVSVAVNLSTVQFRNRSLLQQIRAALAGSGLPPQRLEIEVTESLLLGDADATLSTLHQLRALGVRISMDDFGTGYSALSYLRSFPFDKIKIDKSFVHDISAKDGSRAIVTAVIGLGRSLGMSTAAEGVETEAQLELVRRQGCTEVQGFLFSPPLPASSVTRLFQRAGGVEEWIETLRRPA
jgi:diguanylate cyclase (GGDEF)-like protein